MPHTPDAPYPTHQPPSTPTNAPHPSSRTPTRAHRDQADRSEGSGARAAPPLCALCVLSHLNANLPLPLSGMRGCIRRLQKPRVTKDSVPLDVVKDRCGMPE